MKFLNDFKNLFAIVGVVSIIFWTCASESTSDTTNVNPPQLTGGTYQIAMAENRMVAVNTETGVINTFWVSGQTWYKNIDGGGQILLDKNFTFTH